MLRGLIAELSICALRKLKYSVIIGYRVKGELQTKYFEGKVYDNDFYGVDYYDVLGNRVDILNGKFAYKINVVTNDKVKAKNIDTLKKLIHDVEHGNKDITLRELKAIKWCINELEQGGKHG